MPAAWLIPVSGPPIRPVSLEFKAAGLLVGRHESADIRLASDTVSRQHARLTLVGEQWHLTDLASRWGTHVNGMRLPVQTPIPLQTGDLIRISPWTFNFSGQPSPRSAVDSVDDAARFQTMVRSVTTQRRHGREHGGAALADELLTLLLESAAALHHAEDETQLADALLEAATRGTQLPNAAVLKPLDADGRLSLMASTGASAHQMSFSRSLINTASTGVVASFTPSQVGDISQSIIQMNIDAAICVPLMLGPEVAAYLYLDARDARGNRLERSAQQWSSITSFCLALGRIASLALANLKRIDMERRTARIEAELRAAGEAQRFLLPRRQLTCGPYHCCGESRPGREVGGDLFDLIPLPNGSLAVALGDVSGKGVPASLLMTAAHGFLHAALRGQASLTEAVTHLNEFLVPRLSAEKFITLWIGMLDPHARVLEYVDAGHGYAMICGPQSALMPLDAGEHLPLGVAADVVIQPVKMDLPATGRLVLVSDGIVEQPAPEDAGGVCAQFGIDQVRSFAREPGALSDAITHLYQHVTDHAGGHALTDDATAIVVEWNTDTAT